MLRLVVAACGTETGLSKWTAHLQKTPVFTWGKKYFIEVVEQQVLRVKIYIYTYDSEQTNVILRTEHLDFPDQQG